MSRFFEQLRVGAGSSASVISGFQPDLIITKSVSTGGTSLYEWNAYDSGRGFDAGGSPLLSFSTTDAETIFPGFGVGTVNPTGYEILGAGSLSNQTGVAYLDLAFLKEEGFLDIVTYTGNGTSQTIPHNLGTEVGHLMVKKYAGLSFPSPWRNWHRGFTGSEYLETSSADAVRTDAGMWNNTVPTTTNFTAGQYGVINESGSSFVAYLFAHNPSKGIFCGNYTGTGAAGNKQILGFKPRMIMYKPDANANWVLLSKSLESVETPDELRSFLNINTTNQLASVTSGTGITIEEDGFSFKSSNFNTAGITNYFIAVGDVGGAAGVPPEFRSNDILLYQYLLTQGYTGTINEVIAKWLLAEGFDGQINEAKYKYLESLGYTDFTLPAKDYKWRNNL